MFKNDKKGMKGLFPFNFLVKKIESCVYYLKIKKKLYMCYDDNLIQRDMMIGQIVDNFME